MFKMWVRRGSLGLLGGLMLLAGWSTAAPFAGEKLAAGPAPQPSLSKTRAAVRVRCAPPHKKTPLAEPDWPPGLPFRHQDA